MNPNELSRIETTNLIQQSSDDELLLPGKDCFWSKYLNLNWFPSLREARIVIGQWRVEYNEIRPHSSLNDMSPIEFSGQFDEVENKAEHLNASG